MKKTLIALAVLAASGASFAQSSVTISGKLRYAFVNNSSNTAGTVLKATGVARTDGDVVFTAVEDLGGGLKATANMAIQTGARSVAAGNRDGNLMLSGNFGTVAAGSIDAGNGIYALGSAGGSFIGLDSLVIPDSGNIDYMSYTTPAMNGFAFKITGTDSATAIASDNSQTGLTMGSTGTAQNAIVYGVTYANGPVAAAADYSAYNDNGIAASAARGVDRTRVSASYDLGVAKVGLGYEIRGAKTSSTASTVSTKDALVGVMVPVGAFDLGVNYAQSKSDSNTFTVKGYDLSARYNLSKRTYVALQVQKVDGVNLIGTVAAANDGKISRIQLAHSF
jgi:hypothetical protein